MIKKEDLLKFEKLKQERINLKERIDKLEKKPRKEVIDGVVGSSKNFPYTSHIYRIEGLEDSIEYRKRKNIIKKLKKILKQKEIKIDKEILHIEYELNYIEDSEIREIIRLKYEEGLNWVQIKHKMKFYSESYARMKLNRFFEKK